MNYQKAKEQVLAALREKNASSGYLRRSERCLDEFGSYLTENRKEYSPEEADHWLTQAWNGRKDYLIVGHAVLARLQRIYDEEAGRNTLDPADPDRLCPGLRSELDGFLASLETEKLANRHRYRCVPYLADLQDHNGIVSVTDITYEMVIEADHRAVTSMTKTQRVEFHTRITAMLQYFYGQGMIPYGYTIVPHYLSWGKDCCFWNEISDEARGRIEELAKEEEVLPVSVLLDYRQHMEEEYRKNNYSKTVLNQGIRTAECLLLFLDMNGYGYSPEIALTWLDGLARDDWRGERHYRRALLLIEQYHSTSQMDMTSFFHSKKRRFDLLPDWCREAAVQYVDAKAAEGWAGSTMDMIRASITRFCSYLDGIGIRSFREVTADHVRRFNADDKHQTAAGKNAYNTRIRKFLIFLGQHGYLTNPMLFISLNCTSAPKESIVVVLTEAEMDELNTALRSDDGPLTLRKKAMLLLGLKMGMRESDIVKLRYDDINWNTESIRFVQEKTDVEVNLPMPPEVGNALFHYITEERFPKATPEIFLSEGAPHKPVNRNAGNRALQTALPDRHVQGSGFHVTRRTYATNLLRNGVGAGTVAEALGQRGTDSVSRYLSLDEDRMRKCGLSLEDCGIGKWTHV